MKKTFFHRSSTAIGVCIFGLFLTGCMGPKPADNMNNLEIEFAWKGGGCQLSSPNPELKVYNVPEGTAYLQVSMRDLNKLDFNHGGGIVPYSGNGVVEAGTLSSYKGPCPPIGSHTYQFDVQALNKDKSVLLGRGKITKAYP